MTMITHVSFDRHGVAEECDLERALLLGNQRWKDFTEDQFRRMNVAEVAGLSYKKKFQVAEIGREEYFSAALYAGRLSDTEENRRHFEAVLEGYNTKPFQPIIDLAQQLRNADYHTSVLSNASELTWQAEGSLITSVVDVALSSHHTGVLKPNRRAYEILLEQIGAQDPTTVLFVDDHLTNVEAAKAIGMQGFHFNIEGTGRSMFLAYQELCRYLQNSGVRI